MPLFPWHRLVTCSHLLLSCGASFACLFVVLSPSGTPVLVVFGRAFLALCFLLSSPCVPFCCGSSVSFLVCGFFCLLFCGCLLFGLCVLPLVLWGCFTPFFCWFCCVVRWLPPPLVVASLPPFGCSPAVLVQFLCWSLPLGIWLLHATARLPCLNAWGVVVLCFLASFCFMAAKAFGPVWGLCYPLHHGAFVVVELCAPALRYSSSDDPGPPLNTAKLHTRHSRLHV